MIDEVAPAREPLAEEPIPAKGGTRRRTQAPADAAGTSDGPLRLAGGGTRRRDPDRTRPGLPGVRPVGGGAPRLGRPAGPRRRPRPLRPAARHAPRPRPAPRRPRGHGRGRGRLHWPPPAPPRPSRSTSPADPPTRTQQPPLLGRRVPARPRGTDPRRPLPRRPHGPTPGTRSPRPVRHRAVRPRLGTGNWNRNWNRNRRPEAVALTAAELDGVDLATLDFAALDPDTFEEAVAALCRRDGCADAETVGGAGDLGADVLATAPDGRRVVIQCKRYGPENKVGSQDLQRFGGTCWSVHGAQLAVLVTTSEFTAPAEEYADSCGIRCSRRHRTHRLGRRNRPRPPGAPAQPSADPPPPGAHNRPTLQRHPDRTMRRATWLCAQPVRWRQPRRS